MVSMHHTSFDVAINSGCITYLPVSMKVRGKDEDDDAGSMYIYRNARFF